MIAIFDGHYTSEVSEYAASTLPRTIADRISAVIGTPDVPHNMTTEIQEFDNTLLRGFTDQFDENEDFSDEIWDDAGYVYGVMGYKGDETFQIARRAIVGSTALIAFMDKSRTHIWVASLGDCDAVCGRRQDGKWVPIMLSSRHDADNEEEVERINREHPGEEGIIQNGRLLGWLSVTRALGDFQTKAPFSIGSRGLSALYRAPLLDVFWTEWKRDGHVNMPYMSNVPDIQCHELVKGDMLVFGASDGLRDSMPRLIAADERWDILISFANGAFDSRLGHEYISDEAEALIKNSLFGKDLGNMEKEMQAERDDISVVIVQFK